jgi:RNA-directed DNA polymerase
MQSQLFDLYRPRQLATRLGVDEAWLIRLVDELKSADGRAKYFRQFTLYDPQPGKKPRDIISVRGDLRLIQRRLQNRLFSRAIEPTPFSHGGVRRRDIKSNASQHSQNRFLYLTDIANFYPSIRSERVNQFFKTNGCHPSVARLLTTLTTLDYHLALGLITSPILAEAIVQPVDRRVAMACSRHGFRYSRYVDDICISSKHNLQGSGIAATVRKILMQEGFRVRAEKDRFSRVDEGCSITGLEVRQGRLRVPTSYVEKLKTSLIEAKSIANGVAQNGLYHTKEQLWGRILFVRWVNPGQARSLVSQFRSISWRSHREHSQRQRLIVARPVFVERDAVPPEFALKA